MPLPLYRFSAALAALSAAAVAAPSFPPQLPGDTLELAWCDANDPQQWFTLFPDNTVRTYSGLCVTAVGLAEGGTLSLAECQQGGGGPGQAWTYQGWMLATEGSTVCWNMQSDGSYMSPGSWIKTWDCTPNWNDYFTWASPTTPNTTILANFSSASNASFTNLCARVKHTVPPLPTPDQLAWQTNEIGCFVHFNMASAVGTQGCSSTSPPPNITAWAPTALDTDLWVDVCKSMTGSRAVYVAKHGCGFVAWNSNVSGYNYTVSYSNFPNVDVVASFVDSAQRGGIGYGFYYSTVSNAYANVESGVVQPNPQPGQLNITQEQYDMLVIAHLTELYAAWPLTEVWFDGGYQPQLQPALRALFAELQPHVVAFQGEGLVASPVRWVGSESGLAPYPCWSTCDPGSYGAGDPSSGFWFPAETDCTLQNGDNWFYAPTAGVHSPQELRQMYETSVGHNTAMIIDIAPFPNGTVPPEQVQAASTLGQFITGCYKSAPVATTSGTGYNLTVTPSTASQIDRVVVSEDQSFGQRIRVFSISATLPNGTVVPITQSGSSVGNKFIEILPSPLTVSSVTVSVAAATGTPYFKALTLLACDSLAERLDKEWEEWAEETGYNTVPRAAAAEKKKEEEEGAERVVVAPWRVAARMAKRA